MGELSNKKAIAKGIEGKGKVSLYNSGVFSSAIISKTSFVFCKR